VYLPSGRVSLFCTTPVRNVAPISVYVGLCVKSTFCLPILMKPGICQQILVKLPSTEFRAISFGISQDSTNGKTSFTQITPSLLQLYFPNFTFMWPCIVTNFFIIKPTRCTNFTNLFWHETLHVSDSSSAHHPEFIHCALGNGICHTSL
jgi:hypothetical protein